MSFVLRTLCAGALLLAAPAFAADTNPTVTALRLYVFNCGTIEVADVSVFSPGVDQGKHKTLTDTCYLIAHPKGTLMWDTGFNDAVSEMADGVSPAPGFQVHMMKSLANQLRQIGYKPEAVTYLGLSHMHFDHIGNVNLFPKATLLMQKEEYASAFGPDAAKYGNDPSKYPTLKDNPVKQLSGDYDVFGDGSVVIKRAVGHTPGHQALFLKLPKSGKILLSGDLVHFTENWNKRRVPAFNVDQAASLKTMDDTAAFLKAEGATLWIQHDAEQNADIKHAPAWYE